MHLRTDQDIHRLHRVLRLDLSLQCTGHAALPRCTAASPHWLDWDAWQQTVSLSRRVHP